jgi:hypothetical protein
VHFQEALFILATLAERAGQFGEIGTGIQIAPNETEARAATRRPCRQETASELTRLHPALYLHDRDVAFASSLQQGQGEEPKA